MKELAFASVLIALAACQQITYHNEGDGTITVEGSAPSQERGRNSPPVLNPEVRDNTVDGLPGVGL